MNHLGTQTLETPRLILRPFTLEDAPAMYRNWASDPEVTKYLTWPTHPSVQVSQMVLSDWVSCYEKKDYYQWAIVLRETDEPIGSMAVVSQRDDVGKAEIGYCIGRRWWRQGITPEALSAVIRFLMDEVGMQRIEARHDPRNPASGAVMRKCGMTFEGTLRRSDWNNQGLCDASYYAIVKE